MNLHYQRKLERDKQSANLLQQDRKRGNNLCLRLLLYEYRSNHALQSQKLHVGRSIAELIFRSILPNIFVWLDEKALSSNHPIERHLTRLGINFARDRLHTFSNLYKLQSPDRNFHPFTTEAASQHNITKEADDYCLSALLVILARALTS